MNEFLVVENFEGWNEWYGERKIGIDEIVHNTDFYENQGVILRDDDSGDQVGIVKGDHVVPILKYFPCKINPRNNEQQFALSILKDNNVPLKILSGVAGSGKTLLACAHAVEQLQRGNKTKIIIAKSMTPVGRDIGFLKGDLYDKVRPWLGPFYDNFIQCGIPPYEIDKMIEMDQIEIVPITFIQGRSISNAIIIIDEVQNLDLNIVKQIVTRASEGSEIILLGDQTQKFSFTNDKTLEVLVHKGRISPLVGSVHLSKSLRSPIANWAVSNL